ncbi:MAG: MarR family transcriptional regulator [Gaiellaceae bacterium]
MSATRTSPRSDRPGEGRDGVQWLSDLIRLEIVLWGRIDTRLKEKHGLPLSSFESLSFISRSHEHGLRVGELAEALGVTVGGTSKLVDRIERSGLIRREPDPDDRRASRVTLTPDGRRTLAAAVETYEAELASLLDAVLGRTEQALLHSLVARLLASTREGASS